jgi:hypothetical protein
MLFCCEQVVVWNRIGDLAEEGQRFLFIAIEDLQIMITTVNGTQPLRDLWAQSLKETNSNGSAIRKRVPPAFIPDYYIKRASRWGSGSALMLGSENGNEAEWKQTP